MRVFKVADGTSWVARLHDAVDDAGAVRTRTGWEAVVFEGGPSAVAQRLVYRPNGWLAAATPADLAQALEEGVPIRVRWGD
ncbi:MAG TPA: hypothetical protein VFZ69_02165 [Longimicrobiales bacterium]